MNMNHSIQYFKKQAILFFMFILCVNIVSANQTVQEGDVFIVGANVDIMNISGYQIQLSYDPKYIQVLRINSADMFAPRQTYFKSNIEYNTSSAFEFMIENDCINIIGNLVDFIFIALKPTNGTKIYLTDYMTTDQNGIGTHIRDFNKSCSYETIEITPKYSKYVSATRSGLMTILSHSDNPAYDQTDDGITDIQDYIYISRAIQNEKRPDRFNNANEYYNTGYEWSGYPFGFLSEPVVPKDIEHEE